MQKKQIIQFVVLIMAVILMASAYFGIRTYNKKQEDKAQREEAAAVITLTSFEPDAVTAVSYDYDGSRDEFVRREVEGGLPERSDIGSGFIFGFFKECRRDKSSVGSKCRRRPRVRF